MTITWEPTGDGHHLFRIVGRHADRCPTCGRTTLYDMHQHPLPCLHPNDYRYARGGPTYDDRLRDGFAMLSEGDEE